MFKTSMIPLLICLLFISLIAFKPYNALDHAVGVPVDSTGLASAPANADSLFVEQSSAVVILNPSVTDSLAESAVQKEKQDAYWKEQNTLLDKRIAENKARVRKKQQTINQQHQTLLSQDEVLKLVEKQKTPPTAKARDKPQPDPATGLLSQAGSGERKGRPN